MNTSNTSSLRDARPNPSRTYKGPSIKHSHLHTALLGYGKMGRAIELAAKELDCTIYLSPPYPKDVVFVDFSVGSAVKKHVRIAASYLAPIVVGTTGWEKDKSTIEKIVLESGIGLIYGPNFSPGAAVLSRLLQIAKKELPDWGLGGFEIHHAEKKDAPSGTAKWLSKVLGQNESFFSSVRMGHAFGTHTVMFDCPEETLTLSHTAKSRLCFAKGALTAAKWIRGKKGMYQFEEIFNEKTA